MKQILLAMAFVSLIVPGCRAEDKKADAETVRIIGKGGKAHEFTVEIADTAEERTIGLMFRKSMDDGHGMLFIFDDVAIRGFWMKNTLIPLDIIFIGTDGRIINIEANAQPHDLTPKSSEAPATAVLEINGGLSHKLGIRPGDKVLHKVFAKSLAVPKPIH